jgi:hypothetical protein
MTDSEEAIALDIPVAHLDAPAFCAADPELLAQWADQLPRANLGDTSHQLFDALQQLNQCRLEPRLRFDLLEVLRPAIYSTCRALAAHYQNGQTIVLSSQAFQVYLLSQTMQSQLATGYRIAAHDASIKKSFLPGKSRQRALVAQAVQRAISELTANVFRGCIIYADPDPAIWRQLHTLYRFACQRQLQAQRFADPETGQPHSITVEQYYIKALLLGSVRANQLRQEDLRLVFDQLSRWVELTQLSSYEAAREDHIVVDTGSDQPPVYQALFIEPADSKHCRMLSLHDLLHHLGELLAVKERSDISDDLIKHLLMSWSSYTRRTFMRMDTRDTLLICVGMSNLHYFSADEIEFADFIRGNIHRKLQVDSEKNPFLQRQGKMKHEERDLWNSPFVAAADSADLALESIDNHIRVFEKQSRRDSDTQRSYNNYKIEMINVSPGGYTLEWPLEIAARLANGDVVGIRESQHANWSVGIVSWIRRDGDKIAQIGVKLLGPSVLPYAARVINSGKATSSDNSDDFRRVLLLPEIKLIGQPATLLTPRLPFREKQTLRLVQQGRPLTVRLKKLICATGAINQFDIEVLEKPWQDHSEPRIQRQRFDELWRSL